MVLEQIAWVFKDKTYSKLSEFNKEVDEYQTDKLGSNDAWQPNEIVIDAPQVEIQYAAWLKKRKDLLQNERLSKDYADLFEDEIDQEEGEEAVVIITLSADNNSNFSAGELLLKINNTIANKDLSGYVFFEGLEEADSESDLPAYYMYLGN